MDKNDKRIDELEFKLREFHTVIIKIENSLDKITKEFKRFSDTAQEMMNSFKINLLKSSEETKREVLEQMEKHCVSKEEFKPVRSVVYGLVSLFLIGMIGALIKLIIR